MIRWTSTSALCLFLSCPALWSQPRWEIPFRTVDIQIDGFARDWEGIPELVLLPGSPNVETEGEFKPEGDLEVRLQAVWDEVSLYLFLQWQDDVWDIAQVRRQNAVYVTPDKKRRDRMYFFDNLKFHIREVQNNYLLWISPRIGDEGPYHWQRHLQGKRAMEAATASPVITPRSEGGRATLELLFSWQELRIKPKKVKQGIRLNLVVADSDQPGLFPENKLANLKWIEWNGTILFGKKR